LFYEVSICVIAARIADGIATDLRPAVPLPGD